MTDNMTDNERAALARLRTALEAAMQYEPGMSDAPAHVLDELARAMLDAPSSYWQHMVDSAAQEWQQWAQDRVERIEHAEFFALLARVKADDPTPEDFMRLVELAPPRYREAAVSIANEFMPKPTHCDDEGNPVYSVEQIARHFGVSVERVQADMDRLGLMQRPHAGPIHFLQ